MIVLLAIWKATTGAQRGQLVALAALMLVSALAELFSLGSVIPFLAAVVSPQEFTSRFGWLLPAGQSPIAVTTLVFILAALVAGASRFWLAVRSQFFLTGLAHQWAVEVQRRLLLQPYRFHLEHSSAQAVALTEKVNQFTYGVVQPLIRAVSGVVIGLALGIFLVIATPFVALAVLIALVLAYAGIAAVTSRKLGETSKLMSIRYEQRVRIIQESFAGVRDLILDGLQEDRIARFAAADLDIQQGHARGGIFASAPRILIETAAMIGIALLALAMAQRPGGVSAALPLLGLVALAVQRLLPVAQQLYAARTQLAINAAVTSDVAELLVLAVPAPLEFVPVVVFRREIRLQGVSFTYPGRTAPALRDVSLVIPFGTTVGIVGPSGSGKSTLADLVMGLIEPDHGAVTVDGQKLDAAATAGWQRRIGHVAQSVFLVDDSIARNIAIRGEAIDEKRLARACRVAGVDNIAATLDDGLDTCVGERGGRLSGGQRQRLAFASALYKQPAVLVLDEATSALDDVAERKILEEIQDMEGLTTILIAHRKSTVQGCDLVFRVDRGRVNLV
ncbi:MAG: ABC transporter ATP-binding protein [Sphingomicrobium sp.]